VSNRHPLLIAVEPVALAVGGIIVTANKVNDGDVPLYWDGELVGGMRLPVLTVALDRVIAQVETELGGTLASLSREAKQHAVAMLEERGAFALRKSIEEVADAMGVSRITIYNYLNAIRSE